MNSLFTGTHSVCRRILLPTLVAGLLFSLSGCLLFKSEKNRPGQTDIRQPPPETTDTERIAPTDPGGRYIIVSLAPVLEMGGTFGQTDRRRTLQLGGEFSLGAKSSDRDGLARQHPFWFRRAPLLTAGWLPYTSQAQIGHQAYLEAGTGLINMSGGVVRLSAGWRLHPATNIHGPQFSLRYFDAAYLRTTWNIDHSWSVVFGLTLPLQAVFLQSH